MNYDSEYMFFLLFQFDSLTSAYKQFARSLKSENIFR